MKTWNVILATLVIFTAGIATGALLVIITERAQNHPHRLAALLPGHSQTSTNAPREPAHLVLPFGISARRGTPKEFLDRLDTELKLTPDQHAQIEKILDDGQQQAAQLWQTIAPQIREGMKSTREKIRDTLTSDQRVRFEELMRSRPPKGQEAPPPVQSITNSITNPPAGPATNAPAETPAK